MQEKVVDWLYNLQSRWGILKEEERSLYGNCNFIC